MFRILGCLVLLIFADTLGNESRLQKSLWNYSLAQGYKFNQTIESWLKS